MKLSILIVAKDAQTVIEKTLKSLDKMGDEILVLDNESRDNTGEIAEAYGAKVFRKTGQSLGHLKNYLIKRAKNDWILLLDSDETLSQGLREEIEEVFNQGNTQFVGYRIPYQNHVFGKPVYYGGEAYSKIRLFSRKSGYIQSYSLHEDTIVKGEVGKLKNVINHYSYRNLLQLFKKFTSYAWLMSKLKALKKERISLSKIFLYGPHMFWARYIKDKGYLDGWQGFILAFAFAYMEQMTYFFLLYRGFRGKS